MSTEHVRELHIEDVPAGWANNDPVTGTDQLRIALLRMAGCGCAFPILRPAFLPSPDAHGVRCKACNAQVFLAGAPEALHRRRVHDSHRACLSAYRSLIARNQDASWLAEEAACTPDVHCGPGCGCDDAKEQS